MQFGRESIFKDCGNSVKFKIVNSKVIKGFNLLLFYMEKLFHTKCVWK